MNAFRKLLSLDLRALALMRIGIGCVLIFDLAVRFSDYVAFYSDYGVLPREASIVLLNQKDLLSLFFISGEPSVLIFLFAISFWSHFHVLIGKNTRVYTIISWILLLSIQNRNTFIGQAGDDLLRLALLWGIFLPLNKYFSWDTKVNGKSSSTLYFSWAGVGLTILVFSLYFFSACAKTSREWTTDFTAVYYALSLDQITLSFGKWLYQFPELLKVLTAVVYGLEWGGPFLLFIPWKKNVFRLLFVLLFVSFHLGLAATLFIGFFPAIVIVILLAFLPSSVFDRWRFLKRYTSPNKESTAIEPVLWKKTLASTFIILVISYQFLWNCKNKGWIAADRIPYQNIAYHLRLDQSWGMFAPGVFKDDGWFIFEGVMSDSTVVDISRNGEPVRYGKPADVASLFKNDRWRKYSENLLHDRNKILRKYYAVYLYEKWLHTHPDTPLAGIRLVYMKEFTFSNYLYSEPKRRVLLEWRP